MIDWEYVDWDFWKGLTLCIVSVILIFGLIIAGAGFIDHKIFMKKYAGNELHCIEDSGVEFTTTIDPSFDNWFFYFENNEGTIQTKERF